ncbi:uncharacterized protein [Panulirus ornatus]|uniref:uncharacterized protein n=1 Tax=Panulirus ornatus TaxID=150431 RepID=UPI003A884583
MKVTMGSQVGATGTEGCNLSVILNSCTTTGELLVKAEAVMLSLVSGQKLPTWSSDANDSILKWTHKIIISQHTSSACCFVRMLTAYASSNQDVNSYSILEVYLQMNYFATKTVILDEHLNQSQLWHSLTGLFYSLIEYHLDTVLSRFCDVGQSLLKPFVDVTKPLNVRTRCIKDLNELLKLSPSMARDVFKKKCYDLFKCLPSQLQEVGDYDVQASVVEAIYRMSSSSERSRFVSHWFPDLDCTLQSLFITISEFDPDCRRFLNAFNTSLGAGCMVHTFPCYSAAIGQLQLNKPMSPAYTKFWVDFNLGSETILLLCQKPVNPGAESTQDPPWESLVLYPQDVQKVTLTRTVQVYTLEIFMVNVESVTDMFASPLSQQSRLLLSQRFFIEFAPQETLERVCAVIYGEKLRVVVLEPEGWVHTATRNASVHSGEGGRSSASGRRYRKCSMNIVHCKASGTSTSDPQSEVCIAKKRKVEQGNSLICVPLSQSSSASSYKKQRKSSIAYSCDPYQNVPEMAVNKDRLPKPKETSEKLLDGKFTKTSRCSLYLDFDIDTMTNCYSEIHKEIQLGHERERLLSKKDQIEVASCMELKNGKEHVRQLKESPDINTTSQDVMLLNLAMDSIEGHIEHNSANVSSVPQKKSVESKQLTTSEDDIIPCSLNTQEEKSYLNNRVTPKCWKAVNSVSSAVVGSPKNLDKSMNLCHSKYVSDKARDVPDPVTSKQEEKSLDEQITKKTILSGKEDVKDETSYSSVVASSELGNARYSHNTKVLKRKKKIRVAGNSYCMTSSKKTQKVENWESPSRSIKSSKLTPSYQTKKKKRCKTTSLITEITKVYPLRNRIKSQSCTAVGQLLPTHKVNAKKSLLSLARGDLKQKAKFVPTKTISSPRTLNLSVKSHASLKFTSPKPESYIPPKNSRPNMLCHAYKGAIKYESLGINSPRVSTKRSSALDSDSVGADDSHSNDYKDIGVVPVHDHHKIGYKKDEAYHDSVENSASSHTVSKAGTLCPAIPCPVTTPFVQMQQIPIPVAKTLELSTGAGHQQPGLLHIAPPKANTLCTDPPNAVDPVTRRTFTKCSSPLNAESVYSATPKAYSSSPGLPKGYTTESCGRQTAEVQKYTSLYDSPRVIPVKYDPSRLDNPISDTRGPESLKADAPTTASEVNAVQTCTLLSDNQSPKIPEADTLQETYFWVNDKRLTAPEAHTKHLDKEKCNPPKPYSPKSNVPKNINLRPGTPWPVIYEHDTPRPETLWHGTHWPEANNPDTPLPKSIINAMIPATIMPSPCKPTYHDPNLNPVSPKSPPTSPTFLKSTPFKPISPKASPSYHASPLKITVIPSSIELRAECEFGLSQTAPEDTPKKDDDDQLLNASHLQSVDVPVHTDDVKKANDSLPVTEVRHQEMNKLVICREINLLTTVCQTTDQAALDLNCAIASSPDSKDDKGVSYHGERDDSLASVRHGSKKSPSKGLVSSLMILADYPVKPIGFKTPSKVPYCTNISKLGSRSADYRSKNQVEKKERWKSYESLHERNKSYTPSIETNVKILKSKKKLFDTSSLLMLEASPPNDIVCTFDDIDVKVPCNSTGHPSKFINEPEESGSTEKCKNVADTDGLSDTEMSSEIPKKDNQGYPSADSKRCGEKENIKCVDGNQSRFTKAGSKFRSFHKFTSLEKDKSINTSSKSSLTTFGYVEYPKTEESELNVSHGVYSDFDSSGKETEHSWLHGQKKSKKFKGSTYSNRTKSHSRSRVYEFSSDDDWRPFVKKKRKSRKEMSKCFTDIDKEVTVSGKTRCKRKLQHLDRFVSSTERNKDVKTDNKSMKRKSQDVKPISHIEESDNAQNESIESLCHPSRSSPESRLHVYEFSSGDEWRPLDKKKRKTGKEKSNCFTDIDKEVTVSGKTRCKHVLKEVTVSGKTRCRRVLQHLDKSISSTERSTDVETDNRSMKRKSQDDKSTTHVEESDIVQNESIESLRHTSKSSPESSKSSMMEFKLAAFKGKDDRYSKVRTDIEESFGFSSPELSGSPKVKEPQQKRVRKLVEDMEIKAMIENILPQQQNVQSKPRDVKALDTCGMHVPDPPNNTPVSVEGEHMTQTFDVNEISEIFEDKPDPQNSPAGRLQSTLIHEKDHHLGSSARFSYVSEADTSYIDSRGDDMSKNRKESLNASVNELKENYSSPSPKTGINSQLKFDNDSEEEANQKPFDMIPKHSWMSSDDEDSLVVEEITAVNENNGSKEICLCHVNSTSATTQATSLVPINPLVPIDSVKSQDLFCQEKLIDLPTPSLLNHGILFQEQKKQNLDTAVGCEVNKVTSSSQTSAVLSSLLNRLTNQAFGDPVTQHQETPSTTKTDETPVLPAPRILFSTLRDNQVISEERSEGTEKETQPGQKDFIATLQCLRTCLEDLAESLCR